MCLIYHAEAKHFQTLSKVKGCVRWREIQQQSSMKCFELRTDCLVGFIVRLPMIG